MRRKCSNVCFKQTIMQQYVLKYDELWLNWQSFFNLPTMIDYVLYMYFSKHSSISMYKFFSFSQVREV